MKVDYYLPPVPLSGVVELTERAGRLGYDGLFSTDTQHDPFLPLSLAAPAASGLHLGTAIAVAFARSPMTVAYAAWDLAEISGGRFLLGLGTQIRAHIVRRFSMPWGQPAERLAEYIRALRAIWNCWQRGERLRFKGDFYEFTLMTPFFNPGPIRHPDVPIYIAGVGRRLCRLAGELCQGFHVHPFHTNRYLDEVVLPNIGSGAQSAGRSPSDVEIAATVFVVTGRDEREMETSAQAARQQIAFYASTPAYAPVLELHGWDFGPTLTAMSKRGEWAEMADVITDDVLEAVAVVAPIDELGAAMQERCAGRIDRVGYYPAAPLAIGDDEWAALIEATRA